MESTTSRTFRSPRLTTKMLLEGLILVIVVDFMVTVTYPRFNSEPVNWGLSFLVGLFTLALVLLFGVYQKEILVDEAGIVFRQKVLLLDRQTTIPWDRIKRVEVHPDIWAYLSGWAVLADWRFMVGREPKYKVASLTLFNHLKPLTMSLDFGKDENSAFLGILQDMCNTKGIPYQLHWR